MPYKEKPTTKLYHSISEVANHFEVNNSLIRFWEREFDIIKPKRNKKGNRLFTQKDMDNFLIRELYAWLKQHLAEHQLPVNWYLVEAIPRTSRGKINRENVAKVCSKRSPLDLRRILSEPS